MANKKQPLRHGYIIPIKMDQLVVSKEMAKTAQGFAGQLVDFSLLPHAKKGANCDLARIRPNISEDLVAKPFEATNDLLEEGVHLRWTLPEAFRRARVTDVPHTTGGTTKPEPKFREVPNRWMVERQVYQKGKNVEAKWESGKAIEPRIWIIESDALSTRRERGSRAFPVTNETIREAGLPEYKYLGKVYHYEEWKLKPKTIEAYEKDYKLHADKVKEVKQKQNKVGKEQREAKQMVRQWEGVLSDHFLAQLQQQSADLPAAAEEGARERLERQIEILHTLQQEVQIAKIRTALRAKEEELKTQKGKQGTTTDGGGMAAIPMMGMSVMNSPDSEKPETKVSEQDILASISNKISQVNIQEAIYREELIRELRTAKEEIRIPPSPQPKSAAIAQAIRRYAENAAVKAAAEEVYKWLEKSAGQKKKRKGKEIKNLKKLVLVTEQFLNTVPSENGIALIENEFSTVTESLRELERGEGLGDAPGILLSIFDQIRELMDRIDQQEAAEKAAMAAITQVQDQIDILEAMQRKEADLIAARKRYNEKGYEMGDLVDELRALDKEKPVYPFEYLDRLTAFGYGEPLFAAYYPESRNVFGMHDDMGFYFEGEEALEAKVNFWLDQGDRLFNAGAYDRAKKAYENINKGDTPKQVTDYIQKQLKNITRKNYDRKANSRKVKLRLQKSLKDAVSGVEYEIRYIVSGWYQDPLKDPMTAANFKVWCKPDKEAEEANAGFPIITPPTAEAIIGLVPEIDHGVSESKEEFNWFVELEGFEANEKAIKEKLGKHADKSFDWDSITQTYPFTFEDQSLNEYLYGRSIFVGKVHNVIWSASATQKAFSTRIEKTKLALGNNSGQALAALLAASHPGKEEKDLEKFLDILQLGLLGQEERQDFRALLESGLHESGFNPTTGESRWTIRTERIQKERHTLYPGTQEENTKPPALNTDWAIDLEALNQLQKEVDKEEFKLEDRRRQLYADWYKFMLAEYDYSLDDITYEGEVNNIREYLAVEAVELQAAIEAQQGRRDDIRSTAEALHVKVETWNHENPNAPYRFRLQPVQGARYWEPTEPVLLFAGEDATPSEVYLPREGRERVLFFENLFPENMNGSDDIPGFLSRFLMKNGFINITSNDGSKDPWGPLFMDWQVELFPFTKPQGANAEQKNWPSNTIVEHFDLPKDSVDLHLENKEVTDSDHYKRWIENHPTIALQSGRSLQTFEGRSILTPDAHRPLVTQLKRLLDEATAEGKNNMEGLIKKLEKWSLLAQSLSGFNDALLMRKQILQLPIDDPLARTTILKEFAGRIKDIVGDQNTVAPLPSNLFLPLREGAFLIRKVRLVDCWGRVKELKKDVLDSETNPVIVAEPMKQPKILGEGKNSVKSPRDMAYLPPRIVQPCRLNFRWLSAGNSDTHPAGLNVEAGKWGSDSPICGYVLPNFLDQSLHVHDAAGRGLGVLARSGAALVWNPFPGRKSEHNPPASYHPYLKQLVESFRHHGVRFLNAFLETAQKSMAGTQPENYAQFDGMPLLVGRPLALVRAQCSMELRGQAAVNNSWPSRQQVYSGEEGASSPTLDFDQLRFALQVGDPHKVDDGLLAFYLDTPLEASSDDPDTAIISELFAPIVEVDADGGAETFWAELGKLEKILGIYKNRREGHLAALKKLENEDKASLDAQLEFFNTNSPEDHSEQIAAIREELDRIDQKITVLQTKCNELALDISDMQGAIFRAKAVQGQQAGGANIYKPESDLLALTFDDDPVTLGILMDPRAGLYLKTGILPEKRIDIPSEQFADALNRIQIAFLTTPVISPIPRKAEVEGASSQLFFLTSPKQTGYQWGWMQQESRNTWEEIPPDQITQPPYGFLDQFEPQAIYEGWMTLLKDQENEQPNGNE